MSESRPPVCDYEGSDYQASFWEHEDRAYEDRVEAVALRRLLPAAGELLLEVGAGAGRNTPRYSGFNRVVLLDYSYSQLQQARDRLGDDTRYIYVAGDVYRLPFAPAVFDAATMIRTLHHMVDPFAALQQVRATLRVEARFVLEYANKRNLKSIGRWILRRQTWNPFDRDPVEFAHLNFDFHPLAVRAWLQDAGFALERQLTVSHFRLGILKKLIPLGLLVSLDSVLQWTGGLWQLTPSVFVQSRAVGGSVSTSKDAFWRCPSCESLDLKEASEGLQCGECNRTWPLREGIFVFKDPVRA